MWTDAKIEQLKKLHKDGVSFSAIALEMGMSRSAVIGKANRMKLTPRKEAAAPLSPEEKARRQRKKEARASVAGPLPSASIRPTQPRAIAPRVTAAAKSSKRKRVRLPKEFMDELFAEAWSSELSKPSRSITNIPNSRQCKYISGDVKAGDGKWSCRKPVHKDSSWCKHHYGIVYTGLPQRKPRDTTKPFRR